MKQTRNQIINQIFAGIILKAASERNAKLVRKLALGAYKLLSKGGNALEEQMKGLQEIADQVEAETSSWIEPEDIEQGGAFDTLDLRHWLRISELAGVPAIPGRVILALTEDELDALNDDPIEIPESLQKGIVRKFKEGGYDRPALPDEADDHSIDRDALIEKIFAAMDDVPHDWMVRSSVCGGNILKSMAGAGTVEKPDEAFSPGENIKVGAGYVTLGNRRHVDVKDDRVLQTFCRGHKETIHYIARPWMTASRYYDCEDPHRHGTVFAGKGKWPAEWRVYIENGKVIGVANYYSWAGDATPENARKAFEAVELAEKIVSKARELKLFPRNMDVELGRNASHSSISGAADRFDRDGISCTLDFMETEELGMALLEGGPAHTPYFFSGAHPTAFAGVGLPGTVCKIDGVALKLMDHVLLADERTWKDGDHTDHILSWDEARHLAGMDNGMTP